MKRIFISFIIVTTITTSCQKETLPTPITIIIDNKPFPADSFPNPINLDSLVKKHKGTYNPSGTSIVKHH
jgi:hypothetical protein